MSNIKLNLYTCYKYVKTSLITQQWGVKIMNPDSYIFIWFRWVDKTHHSFCRLDYLNALSNVLLLVQTFRFCSAEIMFAQSTLVIDATFLFKILTFYKNSNMHQSKIKCWYIVSGGKGSQQHSCIQTANWLLCAGRKRRNPKIGPPAGSSSACICSYCQKWTNNHKWDLCSCFSNVQASSHCSRQLLLSHLAAASSSMTILVVGQWWSRILRPVHVRTYNGAKSGFLWVGCVWMMKALMLLTDTPIPRPNKHHYHHIYYCCRHHFNPRLSLIQV